MVTPRKTTTRAASNRKAKTTKTSAKAVSAETLRDRVLTGVQRKYKISLPSREQRIATKVGHAVREKIGKDIQSKVDKFDWREWNTKIFPKLFGEPDQLKYPIEVIASAAALIYDSISEETQQAIADLIEFNSDLAPKKVDVIRNG